MNLPIREQLFELAEENYRKFSAGLIPGKDNIIGVRLPILRNIAKNIAKEDWKTYFQTAESHYLEEVLLRGMVIGYANIEIEEKLRFISEYIPLIDNWSVCDSFCSGLKATNTNKERMWDFIQPYLMSDKEYDIRFAVVMILNYYVTEEYVARSFEHFNRIKHNGYYVMMAVAWAISIYYIKLPEQTMEYLKNNKLDDLTFNKALQKIIESNKVDKEKKDVFRSMKRKSS